MKALLINPKGVTIGLNLGLGYIAASVQRKGHSVKGLDLNNYRATNPELFVKESIDNYKPDIIGISVKSLTYNNGLDIAKSIKRHCSIPIVFGGVHTSIAREQILKENECVDYVLIGESEESFVLLMESMNEKPLLKKVQGLIYRNGSEILINEFTKPINDLDTLSFPDYGCFGIERIEKYPILTSRGCPYSCSYCLAPSVIGKKWRARSVENIIQEIIWASKTYKIDSLQIMDDNFPLKRERVVEFCNRYLKEGFKFPWECSNGIRADNVDDELAKLMKGAGLFSVCVGIESLHPEVYKQINKGESLDDIKKAVKAFKKVGVAVTGFFIIGLPDDNYERTLYSYREAKKIGIDKTFFQILMPFPMTKVYDWVNKNAHIISDYSKASARLGDVSFETKDFSAQERREAYLSILVKNFSYPYDIEKSKLNQIFYLLKLVCKYDLKNIHKHLYKFFVKGVNIILKGTTTTITGIHFKCNLGGITK
ncbi:MAG: B12-binding domain-containing radical SAM protein [Candidatus Kuenenia stuttgartiensis]|nr:B12-binding domain-containing radical SAM protein [Candidatus Kuenenia stuttgartiensis]